MKIKLKQLTVSGLNSKTLLFPKIITYLFGFLYIKTNFVYRISRVIKYINTHFENNSKQIKLQSS